MLRRAHFKPELSDILAQGKPSLCVRLSGGVGDGIVIARYMRDLLANTPGAAFDVYCTNPATCDWIFAGVAGYRRAYHDLLYDRYLGYYDVALRISQFVLVHVETLNWARLAESPCLTRSLNNIIQSRPALETVIQNHPFMDNYLGSIAVFINRSRRDFLHGMTKIAYGGDHLQLPSSPRSLETYGLATRRYVVVHNGFDTHFSISAPKATKCYPHFAQVIAGLRRLHADLRFVQIGSWTSDPIEGVDVDLIEQTSLPEAAALIAGAALLLDNEGGLVHVAACVGTRSCVVFGPTPSRFFGYPDNINVDPTFCGGCWWIVESWMEKCPRGFLEARCMSEQPPEAVVEQIAPFLVDRVTKGPESGHNLTNIKTGLAG